MNESPEASTSTDEPPDESDPVQAAPELPTEHLDAVESDSQSMPTETDPNTPDASTTRPSTRPNQRPPRTQQILTIAVLVLLALSAVVFAIEVATQ